MNVRAYAKINLGLRVLHKRPDGYHDLETVFHQIDVFDELELRLHEGDVSLSTNLHELPTDDSNLCVRAAHLLRDLTGTPDGVEIRLQKNIPLGAGLGGGSSDAAATLKGLANLWNLDISEDELHSLALTLGSDVPFFIKGGTAFATGRGEKLEPLSVNFPYWIIVITPPVHVSTAWAYKNLRKSESPQPMDFKTVLQQHLNDPDLLSRHLLNDFEPTVLEFHGEIKTIKERLHHEGAEMVSLTGSGSSVFGLTRSEEAAKQMLMNLSGLGRVSLTSPFFSPSKGKKP